MPKNLQARFLMWQFNSTGVFGNRSDTLTGLNQALARRFAEYSVRTVGSVALFAARRSA